MHAPSVDQHATSIAPRACPEIAIERTVAGSQTGGMGLVQKIAKKLAPGAEAETKRWVYTCPACQAEGNAWDLGWVITGTRTKGHTRAIACPACKAKVTVTLSKRP